MTNYARGERAALCDLLLELGPDQPTLCTGWQTRDLAAHLLLRDRRPLAALGIALPPLAGYTQRVQDRLAAGDFAALVDRVRQPPHWSPRSYPPLEGVTDTMEMFIHYEDVRRAQPGWTPRELPAAFAKALWSRARMLARLRLRRFPAEIRVEATGLGQARTGRGGEPVRLAGAPGELMLFLSGRQRATQVELTGPEPLADRLRQARLGI